MIARTALAMALAVAAADPAAVKETEQFRTKHETDYRRDYVTLAGLFSLNAGGDRRTIRVRDVNGAPAKAFEGFHWFPIDPKYRVRARFIKDLKPDGTAVLDFNQAYNPPCSFNPYTTCPLPPKENRLTVRMPAGEKAYPHPPAHTNQ